MNIDGTKQIESAGNILTIGQRERVARQTICSQLNRLAKQLKILNRPEAADLCKLAVDAIRRP